MAEQCSIHRAEQRHGQIADDIGDGKSEDLFIQLLLLLSVFNLASRLRIIRQMTMGISVQKTSPGCTATKTDDGILNV
jgi:hypothetical protein